MAEGEIHKKLKVIGMKWLKEKVTDIVAREVKYKNIRSVADTVGINIKRKEVRIIEVKATKADYTRDEKLMDIDKSYYKHCNYFYIMCPIDVIPLEFVPIEYGVLYVDLITNEVIVKRNPKKYTGRLKTQFNTSLKNTVKVLTNDLLYHFLYPQYNIQVKEYKKKIKRSKKIVKIKK